MQNKITLVVGRKGHGKTTWTKEQLRGKSRLLIVDHLREYRDGLIFTTFDQLAEYFETEPKKFCCICRFEDDDEVSALLSFAYELGKVTVVAEEVDKTLCSPNSIDQSLYDIINYGRHRQIDMFCCARRAGDVHACRDVVVADFVSGREHPGGRRAAAEQLRRRADSKPGECVSRRCVE